ncbi:MAG: hypothetical protein ACLQG5_03650 [Methanobacterium sp.]|jgi:hypothetical protein
MDDREHYHGLFGFRMFWPLLIGVILILLGLSALLGIDIWRYLWPIVIILVGLLIIVSALFGRHRRY